MFIRFVGLIVVLVLVGCTAVPVVDESGQPVLHPDGTPKTKQVLDPDKAGDAAQSVAAFLPPPFGQLAAILVPFAVAGLKRRKPEPQQ